MATAAILNLFNLPTAATHYSGYSYKVSWKESKIILNPLFLFPWQLRQSLSNRLRCFLVCLVTLIINIYDLGVGISTIKKFTSGRGGVWLPQGLSYEAFNLPSHPDH
jgi:hypothetical protein